MPPQLIALLTSFAYAGALVSARRGLGHSTPATVTLVSVTVQVLTLWPAVFLTGGIPKVVPLAVFLFVVVGVTQLGVRLLAYTGVDRIGASRSGTLQSISPLVSATIAIAVLRERAGPLVITGTLLVVVGIVLVSWRTERQIADFRWRYLLFPIGAAFLTGINHPIRRYALSLSDEPLFFAALMGGVSLAGFVVYRLCSLSSEPLVWNRRAFRPFLLTGLCETFAIWSIITALSLGQVVVVVPIAATYPVWAILGTAIFLRDLEQINARTVLGTLSVVAGTISIHLAR